MEATVVNIILFNNRPPVDVTSSLCYLLVLCRHAAGIGLLSVYIPERGSVIHSHTVYFLTFAFVVSICPLAGFASGAVSSEERQGGGDERFIQAHAA